MKPKVAALEIVEDLTYDRLCFEMGVWCLSALVEVYVRWQCPNCGDWCHSNNPNSFNRGGMLHQECGHVKAEDEGWGYFVVPKGAKIPGKQSDPSLSSIISPTLKRA